MFSWLKNLFRRKTESEKLQARLARLERLLGVPERNTKTVKTNHLYYGDIKRRAEQQGCTVRDILIRDGKILGEDR